MNRAGGPREGGRAGKVWVVPPVQHLGVVEGDVGVVHWEDGRAEEDTVKESGQQDQEGDGGVQGTIRLALAYLRRRGLFERH